jgi:tRNA nucleotidyltransferase/poly(A) polymerase
VISRDFTINTLHKGMFDDKVIDLLDVGLKDCENKIIRAVSNPEICFNDDPRRAYRAISLATRLNLSIDSSIMDFILKNNSLFMPLNNSSVSETYITSTIDSAIGINDNILLEYLIDSKLLKNIPLIGKFKDLIISNNMISNYLDLLK